MTETRAGGPAEARDGVILRTSGLARSFGAVRAVDGLDLAVHAGEVYGFLGINGAGKTTTIRMLMGIIKPEAGTIEILGQRSRRTTVRQKQSIGYVSQEQTFYPWMTCRALGRFVGGFYPTWDTAEFERLLRLLELPPDRRASQLSGGMRVKLALALALAPRPALLILDEPTSGLDPVARREFLELIRMQARQYQRTTFFSSHIIGEVERVADRVGIIHHGRMLYEGRLEELRATVRQVKVRRASPMANSPPEAALPPIIQEEAAPAQGATIANRLPPPAPAPPAAPDNLAPPCVPHEPDRGCPPAWQPAAQPGSFTLPAGFELLRQEQAADGVILTVRGEPSLWESVGRAGAEGQSAGQSGEESGSSLAGAEVRSLSVEDIFIALVATPAALI